VLFHSLGVWVVLPPESGGYVVDPYVVFRASVQFLDTKDFVYNIAAGTAGDLHVSAGMAGDDSTAHSFASHYEPAATTIVAGIGKAGQGLAAISSRLLGMATNYLRTEDAIAAAMGGTVDTSSGLQQGSQEDCEPSNAHATLPMVTGTKQVHEIPVIGKFWPQGDPDKLRATAKVWTAAAALLDDAQRNAASHAAPVNAECSGQAFTAFQNYAATLYTDKPGGGSAVTPGAPLMENLAAGCRILSQCCTQYADAIDTCRDTLIGLGTAAGIITVAGIIGTIFTFGGSDAAAGAGDAALAGEAAVAADALATAEADAAAASAVAEAEQIIAQAAARLVVTGAVTAAAVTIPAIAGTGTAQAATGTSLAAAQITATTAALPIGPIPPAVPPAFPLYTPAQQAAATTWVNGLPQRAPNYGNPADRAYQLRVAGTPERLMSGANGDTVWADGFRPADGAIIDAKNVRTPGCSPRTLDGLTENAFNTNLLLSGDESELDRYQEAITNPANHAQFLELDTNDPATVGYWQFLTTAHHVTSDVRYVP
jgi:hypothetical protein